MQNVHLRCLPKFSRFSSHTYSSESIHFDLPDIFSSENSLNAVKSFKLLCPQLKIDGKRQAAVLIPLCVVKDEVSILYTLRTINLKRNSGQVSFPGGMREKNEELKNTALRESCEELGISKTNIDIWGSGKFIVSKDIAIMPFLGNIGVIEPNKLNINHHEVQYAFALPLRHFCEPTNCKHTCFRQLSINKLMMIPVYMNDYKRIWGMTAYMTWLALNSIIPQQFTHSIYHNMKQV
ncbi:NUDIX hydrolase domain,NUDIX hydrolase domain-like,NUDIX hydrolase, conserved site [Cinara cedri]|uniref:NUDIX hydrolase domain,NUDIX hydrolase domain-like,NUDIX hydrolase, conserved site n=1 Tax=Cinara cedri TaxID=506608 RepID=A0A5E4N7N7_9HEMI|nr:NUDIX hydrolase domain,NUDIX hydrolase domain-like,NUDIX hydrolase, conserved site [Cinara cedri]